MTKKKTRKPKVRPAPEVPEYAIWTDQLTDGFSMLLWPRSALTARRSRSRWRDDDGPGTAGEDTSKEVRCRNGVVGRSSPRAEGVTLPPEVSEIKRWRMEYADLLPDPQGDLVKYADHLAIVAEKDREIARLRGWMRAR